MSAPLQQKFWLLLCRVLGPCSVTTKYEITIKQPEGVQNVQNGVKCAIT